MSETNNALPPYTKPLPSVDVWSRPFWQGCREGRFMAQRCKVSGEVFFPASPVSPVTRTTEWEWVELSGKGSVFSFVAMHKKYFKGFANELPYLIGMVQLDEGPMLITNLTGVSCGEVKCGDRVEVEYVQATEEITIPKFRVIREEKAV